MIFVIATIIFVFIIAIKSIRILKEDIFLKNEIDKYQINPLYTNTDIPIEKALENFEIIKYKGVKGNE